MTADPPECPDDVPPGDEESTPPGPPDDMGRGFFAALGLVCILVLLILTNPLALPTDAGLKLTKTRWTLQFRADESGTLVLVTGGSEITAQFDRGEGRMGGSSGCNQYSARYTTKGNTISLSRESITGMYCDRPGIMEQESAFLTDLSNISSFRVSGSAMKMYDAAGRTIFVFAAECTTGQCRGPSCPPIPPTVFWDPRCPENRILKSLKTHF